MSTLSFVRFSLISIFAWLQFVVAHPVLRDVGSLGPFANRGEGKYTLDLDVYHRQVKPIFIKRFQGAFSDFTSKCGTNPDFEIDRKGIVNPNAVKGKDLCTKKRFSLDLGDVVLAHQLISDNEDDNSAVDFSGPAVQNLLEVLATWGTGIYPACVSSFQSLTLQFLGKYTLDLDVYHRQVKPIFIKRFQAAFKDFTSKCGTNPDFEIDRKGIVNPNAVKGRTLDLDVHQTTRFNSALDRASAWILSAWI
ncbi:uncharacterized protein LACBIDRAFT_329188 [Laccaria bicolor S238N-H82]|uniref:Predicted protein n=1 Tax=Laccaria bicolor (strain S238N-H82 / ATCC MYA-4686) TaxID=486041 RepID=B0DHB7_LACBS|nr:uncharacterized protein LACBIDRAFT_329188 [Laccaria bicolor S238N-H82]EDR05986.1 predicted protein [Laccaria bicolor S238N-H82]|eukprot:XP_001883274.1 predicted protein [Laccaria bicolor S238N-H82]